MNKTPTKQEAINWLEKVIEINFIRLANGEDVENYLERLINKVAEYKSCD